MFIKQEQSRFNLVSKIYPNITLEMFNVEPLKHKNIVYRKSCVIISFLIIIIIITLFKCQRI